MASTNKTTHYELSQYVSSDKPTYLVDYNGDMAKIDTAINTAKTTADGAATSAGNAATAAETAQSTANTAITNAATADGKASTANTSIGVLANLTTTEKTNLVDAINEVKTLATTSEVVDSMAGSQTDKAPSVSAVKQELSIGKTYSTIEYDTGKVWIDGKKIYGKVLSTGSISGGNSKTIETGLNWENNQVIDMLGMLKTGTVYTPINFSNPLSMAADIAVRCAGTSTILIICGNDETVSSGYIILEYTK